MHTVVGANRPVSFILLRTRRQSVAVRCPPRLRNQHRQILPPDGIQLKGVVREARSSLVQRAIEAKPVTHDSARRMNQNVLDAVAQVLARRSIRKEL